MTAMPNLPQSEPLPETTPTQIIEFPEREVNKINRYVGTIVLKAKNSVEIQIEETLDKNGNNKYQIASNESPYHSQYQEALAYLNKIAQRFVSIKIKRNNKDVIVVFEIEPDSFKFVRANEIGNALPTFTKRYGENIYNRNPDRKSQELSPNQIRHFNDHGEQ